MKSSHTPHFPAKPPGLPFSSLPAGLSRALESPRKAAAPNPAVRAAPARGAWGKVDQYPFFLEAPAHLLDRMPMPNPKIRWFVNAAEAGQVLERMAKAGLPQDIIQAINQPSNRAIIGDQMVFFPPPVSVLKLDPEVRAAVYRELRRYPANVDIVGPLVVANGNVQEWFHGCGLRPELIELIDRMSYRRGDALVFSDLSAVMGLVNGNAEGRQLMSVFTRTRTLILKLNLEDETRLNEVRGFWNFGPANQSRNVLPLLQSLSETQARDKIDVAHLLPPLPRKLLYSYPELSMVVDGEMPDCHWTSLNFFNSTPEPTYLDGRLAAAALLDNYQPVKAPYKYGDLLVFVDNVVGNAFHSCVYIADDVVFTKNGRNLLSPWVLQTLDHARQTYLYEGNGRIQGYRAKSLMGK